MVEEEEGEREDGEDKDGNENLRVSEKNLERRSKGFERGETAGRISGNFLTRHHRLLFSFLLPLHTLFQSRSSRRKTNIEISGVRGWALRLLSNRWIVRSVRILAGQGK